MPVVCKICGVNAVHSIPGQADRVSHYCLFHVPTVHKANANKGLFPLVKPVEEVVEAPAPKKKAAKVVEPEPVIEEPVVVEEAPVEEVATPEEIAVESTDEDN